MNNTCYYILIVLFFVHWAVLAATCTKQLNDDYFKKNSRNLGEELILCFSGIIAIGIISTIFFIVHLNSILHRDELKSYGTIKIATINDTQEKKITVSGVTEKGILIEFENIYLLGEEVPKVNQKIRLTTGYFNIIYVSEIIPEDETEENSLLSIENIKEIFFPLADFVGQMGNPVSVAAEAVIPFGNNNVQFIPVVIHGKRIRIRHNLINARD